MGTKTFRCNSGVDHEHLGISYRLTIKAVDIVGLGGNEYYSYSFYQLGPIPCGNLDSCHGAMPLRNCVTVSLFFRLSIRDLDGTSAG